VFPSFHPLTWRGRRLTWERTGPLPLCARLSRALFCSPSFGSPSCPCPALLTPTFAAEATPSIFFLRWSGTRRGLRPVFLVGMDAVLPADLFCDRRYPGDKRGRSISRRRWWSGDSQFSFDVLFSERPSPVSRRDARSVFFLSFLRGGGLLVAVDAARVQRDSRGTLPRDSVCPVFSSASFSPGRGPRPLFADGFYAIFFSRFLVLLSVRSSSPASLASPCFHVPRTSPARWPPLPPDSPLEAVPLFFTPRFFPCQFERCLLLFPPGAHRALAQPASRLRTPSEVPSPDFSRCRPLPRTPFLLAPSRRSRSGCRARSSSTDRRVRYDACSLDPAPPIPASATWGLGLTAW